MELFEKACQEIDKIHSKDPQKVIDGEKNIPSELLYSNRMVNMLNWYSPGATESVKIAVRCQHFKRWKIPRNKYPMDKIGYHAWRNELYQFQADEASKILLNVGYGKEDLAQITEMIEKVNLKSSSGARTVEDVACLVFFKYYAADFSTKHDVEKVKHIVLRTLSKMSERGKESLLKLELEPNVRALVELYNS